MACATKWAKWSFSYFTTSALAVCFIIAFVKWQLFLIKKGGAGLSTTTSCTVCTSFTSSGTRSSKWGGHQRSSASGAFHALQPQGGTVSSCRVMGNCSGACFCVLPEQLAIDHVLLRQDTHQCCRSHDGKLKDTSKMLNGWFLLASVFLSAQLSYRAAGVRDVIKGQREDILRIQ